VHSTNRADLEMRDTCRNYGEVELMIGNRPRRVSLCYLTDESHPRCTRCTHWTPRDHAIQVSTG